ncbi:ABC transporter ATP-binding protein [Streptomyces sp. TP-A0874]|uniref:ABC transporter ATP-binding protein n=1 Tax=Streptomyces sp. TP-A0874 TaxID=549819 RepID=UPI0008537218|nr:ATP-binding cassette domain-containing protein [Streptomyces sp. TP-A0874]
MNPVIEVRELEARTAGAILLAGVELTVPAGAVTALVGPSGSGKTTTALALLGESEPGVRLTGTVRVAGTTVVSADGVTAEADRVRGGTIAYMPQHPGNALNPARRTGPVLTELARLHRREEPGSRREAATAAEERAAAALEQAQLPTDRALLRRFPHQFSGGQRQRIALAQVLACGPRALILDEPGTGLDTVTRLGLARELAALARNGLAVLLLSHDHDLVRALADRVVLLERGRVVAAGTAGEVLPPPPAEPAGRPGPAPTEPREAPPARGLEVRGLTAWLRPGGRGEVLRDVSLSLPPGGALAVAGRSGSGKTTLARCLVGLHERFRGQVLLDGEELPVLRRRDTAQRRRVQYVWQEVRGSFDEHRPVLEQVARTAVRLRSLTPANASEEAAEMMERLGVAPETARRRPPGLSGGELQRAAFARALLAAPDVLLCDEITASLDDATAERIVAEVDRLRKERGTAVLWIGHDLRLLRTVAERLLVLDRGEVVEEGDCRRVLAAPRSEPTRLLLAAERLGTGDPEPGLSLSAG